MTPATRGPLPVLGVLLGLALAGAASAEGPNLTLLLPTREETAPYQLSPFALQPVFPTALENTRCDATPAEGVRENLERPYLSGTLAKGNKSTARIILYRFANASEAGGFVDCLNRVMGNSTRFHLGPAPYGDRGVVAELSPGAPRGSSILYSKGDLVVSVDATDNSFESATAHAIARSIEAKLNATAPPPAKSPGFEAAAALAGFAAAACLWGRQGRAGRP